MDGILQRKQRGAAKLQPLAFISAILPATKVICSQLHVFEGADFNGAIADILHWAVKPEVNMLFNK